MVVVRSAPSRPAGAVLSWPPDLLASLPDDPWTVAHVRPRQEKRFCDDLRRLNIPSILYLERRVRTYARQGVQESLVPLLDGYVFVAAGPEVRDTLYRTERIVRLLDVRRPGDITQDLRDLAELVTQVAPPLLVRRRLQPGLRVTLTAGCMAGLSGVVVRQQGRCEVVVNVHLLGASVAVACNDADVSEAVPTPDALGFPDPVPGSAP